MEACSLARLCARLGTFAQRPSAGKGRQQLAIRDTFWVMCYQGDPPLQPPIQVAIQSHSADLHAWNMGRVYHQFARADLA